MDKIRIFHLTPFFSPNIGGVESHLSDLTGQLNKEGYNQYVLTPQPLTTKIKALKYEKHLNLEIFRYNWPGFNLFHKLEPYPLLEFLYLTPYLFIISFLFMLKKNKKIDVIHAHGLNAAFTVKVLSWFFRKRIVMSTYAIYNFDPKKLYSKIVRWVLSSFDEILPLANPSKKELINIGLNETKMKLYYLWINPNSSLLISKLEAKEILGYESNFFILFVGRLIPIKGPNIIMEVAKELNEIDFVFIGDGPLSESLKIQSEKLSNVHFLGRVEEERRNLFYCAADIFVLPSIYPEAFGKVAIEAMFFGTPVIGANRGAIPDIINDKVGKIIEPTVENFKKELGFFYKNPSELKSLQKNCHEYVLKNFSINNILVIEEAYSHALINNIQNKAESLKKRKFFNI